MVSFAPRTGRGREYEIASEISWRDMVRQCSDGQKKVWRIYTKFDDNFIDNFLTIFPTTKFDDNLSDNFVYNLTI